MMRYALKTLSESFSKRLRKKAGTRSGRRFYHFGNESGQAIFEYTLILLIMVIIIFTLLYRFSTAFRAYGQNYFTHYVACLLETGELPGNGSCTEEMASFRLADGTTHGKYNETIGPIQDTSSGGSGGGGQDAGGTNGSSSGKNGEDSASKSTADSGSSGEVLGKSGADGGGNSGGGSGGGRFDGFGRKRTTAVGDVAPKSAAAEEATADALLGVSPTSKAVGTFDSYKRRTASLEWGYGEEDREEKEKTRPAVAALSKPAESNSSLKPKRAVETLKEVKSQKASDDEGGFSFGFFIRFLLIAGIILAIVIFFGGQVLQMAKSGEK